MTQRAIRNDADLALLVRFLQSKKRPFTVEITDGRKRSTQQNSLQHKWMAEVAEQLGDRTPEDVRAYCKLHIGVPILREEDPEFRAKYDAVVKPMDYATKLAIMVEPFDFSVTRLMSVEQKTRYLDRVFQHFTEQGIALTLPPDRVAA